MTHVVTVKELPAMRTTGLRKVFAAATHSEWTKLRTVRSTIWALLITAVVLVGFCVLFPALEVSRWQHRSASDIAGFDPSLYSLAGSNLAQLSIGVLGVLAMTSEYATGSIRLTFIATPQRRLLFGAKICTFSAVIVIFGLLTCLPSFVVGQAIFGSQHSGLSLSDPGASRAVVAAAIYLVMVGPIGIALGALLRHTAAAVSVLFAVLLVVSGLVTLLPTPWDHNVTKFLPSSAGTAMDAVATYRTCSDRSQASWCCASMRWPPLLSPGWSSRIETHDAKTTAQAHASPKPIYDLKGYRFLSQS